MTDLPDFHDNAIVGVEVVSRIQAQPVNSLASSLLIPLGVRSERHADLVRSLGAMMSAMPFASPFDAMAEVKRRCVQPSQNLKD